MNALKKTLRRLLQLTLVGMLVLAASPGHATSATVSALIWFQTFGSGNPELVYDFDGYHEGYITEYPPLAALLPATFQGTLLKGTQGINTCSGSAKVKNANFSCQTGTLSACPVAEASWKTLTRLATSIPPFGQVWSVPSGRVIANCPPIEPPGCGGSYRSTKLLAVDLETGRVTLPEWRLEAPRGLERTESIGDKPYFREEWALVSTAGPGQTVTLAAASETALAQVDSYTSALFEMPGFDSDHAYLIIEAARHIGHLTEPLVRLESLTLARAVQGPLSDGRVTFRAGFAPHGGLDSVETLRGSERTARLLAEDLRLEFPTAGADADHRTVVFATFEVEDGRPRFVSAVPVRPQCCCGQFHCS